MSRALRLALTAVLVQLASHAIGACVVVPGASELRIDQIGRVIFQELATDRARDLVTFGGGVCLELGGIEVRIEAETMLVRGAATEGASIEALGATVHAADWRLHAGRLDVDTASARLVDVTLVGHGVVGRANAMVLDLVDGAMVATSLEVVTPTVRLVAASGSFGADDRVTVQDVVASTCDCPAEAAPIRVEGRRASLTLPEGVLLVEDGVLVLDAIRVTLPAELRISEESLAAIIVPFTVGVVPEGDRGVVIGLAEAGEAGAVASGDVALGREADPRWRAELEATGGGGVVLVRARDGALAVAASQRIPLAPGATVVLDARNEGGAVEGRLHDAAITFEGERVWRVAGAWSVEARGSLGAALSAQRLAGADVVHPRARLAGSVAVARGSLDSGLTSLRLDGGATAYVDHAGTQTWFGAAPRWRLAAGGVAVDVQHAWRRVDGASPFDERIDRVLPEHRSDVRLALETGGRATLAASLHVRYDWLGDAQRPAAPHVGVDRLRAALAVTLPSVSAGTVWEAGLVVEAAGAVDPRARRDAFVVASLGVAHADGTSELSLASEIGIGPLRPGMRSLTIAGAAPVRLADGRLTLQPYLALDVWPTLSTWAGPRLVGHGLVVQWATCCGLLDVGYRSQPDGSVTTRLGFAVDAREPSLADLRW